MGNILSKIKYSSRIASIFVFISIAMISCKCQSDSPKDIDNNPAILKITNSYSINTSEYENNLRHFSSNSHVFGSPEQKKIKEWLAEKLNDNKTSLLVQNFTSETPNPILLDNPEAPASMTISKDGYNIFTTTNITSKKNCLVLIGSHYDTKKIKNLDYLGANDSGSSSILLVDLFRFLINLTPDEKPICDIGLIWFDGEEAVLPNWSDGEKKHINKKQDNTYGSRFFVNELSSCTFDSSPAKCLSVNNSQIPVVALILLDMVGSENLKLSLDSNSSAKLIDVVKLAAESIGQPNIFNSRASGIEDDHIPFRQNQIAAIDLIDFNHLKYWHQEGDIASIVSTESANIAGKIAIFSAFSIAYNPKAFLDIPDR